LNKKYNLKKYYLLHKKDKIDDTFNKHFEKRKNQKDKKIHTLIFKGLLKNRFNRIRHSSYLEGNYFRYKKNIFNLKNKTCMMMDRLDKNLEMNYNRNRIGRGL
jgi:hypothetical protein